MLVLGNSYRGALAFSIGIHGIVILSMIWLWETATPMVDAAPAIMEIIPAQVVDTGDMAMKEIPQDQPAATLSNPRRSATQANAQQTVNSPYAAKQSTTSEFSSNLPSMANAAVAVADNAAIPTGNTIQPQASPSDTGTELPAPTSAKIVSGALPAYPAAARKSGWEGSVVVRVLVDTDGSAADVQVRDSSGMDIFDEAAVRSVRRWRFSPATQSGKPIVSYHDVRVRFHLNES